jgi:hypothetical protein
MAHRFAAVCALSVLLCANFATAQEDPMDVVAAAVRDAGYTCSKPQSAKADPKESTPDQKAWIIRCENGEYRVKFKGDEGAEVVPVAE